MVFRVRIDESIIYDLDVEADSKEQAEAIAHSACEDHKIETFIEGRWIRAKARRDGA